MSGIGDGAISTLAGMVNSSYDAGLSVGLMKANNRFEKLKMKRQDRYQRQLMEDSALIQKTALQKAGYNVADPNGTGVSVPTVSAPGFSAPAASMPNGDFTRGVSDMASAELMKSQARLNDIEADYKAENLQSEIDKRNAETKNIMEQLPLILDSVREDIKVKQSQYKLNDKQVQELDSLIQKLGAETESISIDNRFKPGLLKNQIKQIKAETRKLIFEGDIKGVESYLAERGILVNSNMVTQLLSMVAMGSAPELVTGLTDQLGGLLSKLPELLSDVVTSLFEAATGMITRIPESMFKAARDAGMNIWDYLKSKGKSVLDYVGLDDKGED